MSLEVEKHVKYIMRSLMALPPPYTTALPNHLSIVYFMVSGLDLLNRLNDLPQQEKQNIIDWVYSRQVLPDKLNRDGNNVNCGFRGSNYLGQEFKFPNKDSNPDECKCQDGHILKCDMASLANTYCALMILKILGDDQFQFVNREAIVSAMKPLQQADGSFIGIPDTQGENDMRYLYCACNISFMLNDWRGVDRVKALDYIKQSQTYEYGFAQGPGQEAHGGSTYCAIASLALMGELDNVLPVNSIQRDRLVQWLAQKQITGFSGRINKDPDTCYSFWIGASLELLKSYHTVDFTLIRSFIFSSQHPAIGGISKQPESLPDTLHTYMSLSGLSVGKEPGLQPLNCAIGITKRAAGDAWNKQLNM